MGIALFALLILNFPASADDSLTFYADFARFYAGEEVTTVELDFEIPYYSLSYTEDAQFGLRADLQSTLTLKDRKTGEEKSEDRNLTIYITSQEEAEKRGQAALDRREWLFAPGTYDLTFRLTDLNTQKSGKFVTSLVIHSPPQGLFTSDIQFASTIESDTTEVEVGLNPAPTKKFTKNGLRVTPAPSALFNKSRYLLYSYMEIYNLSGDYQVMYRLLDEKGKVVKELPPKDKEKPGPSAIEVGAVNVIALSPGKYRLQVKVKDLSTQKEAISEKGFTILETPTQVSTQIPEWSIDYYDQIEYVASPQELSFYKSLSSKGKNAYLDRFWKENDPDPMTPENEAFLAFAHRIREADSLYSAGFEKGRRTDRGRIYIKYGPPDNLDRRPADIAYKPHEIWSYYSKGGMQFVFLDFSGFGKYDLIYSTVEGNFTHPKWYELIDPTEVEQRRR